MARTAILSPRPRDWNAYLESAPVASDAFMSDVEDLPVRALGLTLVTNNDAEFERVRDLLLDNWTRPPRRRR